MTFVLPPREKVGYLDPEVAGEGQKVLLSDGETVNWSPPPAKTVTPDWSTIKSIRHYFNRTGHAVWPAWLYHPTEAARIVKNAKEAAELGVCYREASIDERGRYGLTHVWDWTEESQWRPKPHAPLKFDPANPGQGKMYVATPPNPGIAQNELLRDLVPLVTAAVVGALKGTGGASAPATVDPAEWEKFLAFQAWQKSQEVVEAVATAAEGDAGAGGPQGDLPQGSALNASPEDERAAWEREAEAKGVKIDRRWSLDRLKAEVQKAA
jgi:hypothetical protein